MSERPLQDAALILVAHGSTLHAGSGASCYQHADELRRRRIFAEVTEAFVQQDPALPGALRRVFSPRVFIVPLFISDGWFTEVVVPIELGLRAVDGTHFDPVQERNGQTIHYCPSVGSHPWMTDVLMGRARDTLAQHPFPSIPEPSTVSLLIAGHGTPYSAGSREAIERQVGRLRASCPYGEVLGVYLEESPRVEDAWTLTRTRHLVLVPFFISEGLHTQEDIPLRLGESAADLQRRRSAGLEGWRNPTERHGKRLWYTQAAGTASLMADIILRRVHEADEDQRRGRGGGKPGTVAG